MNTMRNLAEGGGNILIDDNESEGAESKPEPIPERKSLEREARGKASSFEVRRQAEAAAKLEQMLTPDADDWATKEAKAFLKTKAEVFNKRADDIVKETESSALVNKFDIVQTKVNLQQLREKERRTRAENRRRKELLEELKDLKQNKRILDAGELDYQSEESKILWERQLGKKVNVTEVPQKPVEVPVHVLKPEQVKPVERPVISKKDIPLPIYKNKTYVPLTREGQPIVPRVEKKEVPARPEKKKWFGSLFARKAKPVEQKKDIPLPIYKKPIYPKQEFVQLTREGNPIEPAKPAKKSWLGSLFARKAKIVEPEPAAPALEPVVAEVLPEIKPVEVSTQVQEAPKAPVAEVIPTPAPIVSEVPTPEVAQPKVEEAPKAAGPRMETNSQYLKRFLLNGLASGDAFVEHVGRKTYQGHLRNIVQQRRNKEDHKAAIANIPNEIQRHREERERLEAEEEIRKGEEAKQKLAEREKSIARIRAKYSKEESQK